MILICHLLIQLQSQFCFGSEDLYMANLKLRTSCGLAAIVKFRQSQPPALPFPLSARCLKFLLFALQVLDKIVLQGNGFF